MNNIFITGATGFLGLNLLRCILTEGDNQAYVLLRSRDEKSVSERRNALINKVFPESVQSRMSRRLHVTKGDILKNNMGLSKKDSLKLKNAIDTIYHCAAMRELNLSLDYIRKFNVKGTENLLKTALLWKNEGVLKNINHISTAYVRGKYKGIFYERQLDVSQRFNNTYEQSKFEAEQLIFKYRKKGLPVDIYRPSIITDAIPIDKDNISIALRFLQRFVLWSFKEIPADKTATFNLVPVDAVSKAIYLISTTRNRFLNQTYHIVNSRPVKVDSVLRIASRILGFRKPRLIPMREFQMDDLSLVQRRLIGDFIPYLNQNSSFDTHNASSVFKRYNFKMPPPTESSLVKLISHYQSSGLMPKKSKL